MRPIPQKLRKEMSDDPYYSVCARRNDGWCDGRITIEHSLIWRGRQLNKKFALIPLCVYHHLGAGLDKNKNRMIALNRATDEELQAISQAVDYIQLRKYLNKKYGVNRK